MVKHRIRCAFVELVGLLDLKLLRKGSNLIDTIPKKGKYHESRRRLKVHNIICWTIHLSKTSFRACVYP